MKKLNNEISQQLHDFTCTTTAATAGLQQFGSNVTKA